MILLTTGLALAFAPHAPRGMGTVNVEPQRIQHTHPGEQLRQRAASEMFDEFTAVHGDGWQVLYHEASHSVRALWGEGVPVASSHPAGIADEVESFVRAWAPVMGLGDGLLVRSNVATSRDVTYVDFDLVLAGLPVVRGGVRARVKHGRLVLLHAQLPGSVPVRGSLDIDSAQAAHLATTQGPVAHVSHAVVQTTPVLLEHVVSEADDGPLGRLELRHAWEVRSSTLAPRGEWVTYVDGETGQILNVHNEVRHISGTVSGRHHARTLLDPMVESPIPDLVVTNNGDSAQTDADGMFSLSGNDYSVDLDGVYFDVRNEQGDDALAYSTGSSVVFDASNSTLAESSTAVFLSEIRQWGIEVAPELDDLYYSQFRAHVNIASSCNAYFDPNQLSVNFFRAGGGCQNTGTIADVVYHEWGHGFHLASIESGWWDGSLGEGAADTVAFLQTGDDTIAPTFLDSGGGIRRVGPDRVYPADFVNNQYFVHDNGLIFGGAMWDLLDLLQDNLGEEQGRDVTTDIFTGLLKGGPDIPGSYLEAMLADDNDGDLANGTPHQCPIQDAFGRHGLGPGSTAGVGSIAVEHLPLAEVAAGEAVEVNIAVAELSLDCISGLVGGELFYRENGGAWQSAGGAAQGDALVAQLPAFEAGTFVEYYAELESDEAFGLAPAVGEIAPYSFYAGGVLPLRCDDFEQDDGGYTHRLLSGEDSEGADDWQWGRPNGQSGDPATGFSGDNVWGNDLGYDNFNGAYQDGKHNRLAAPELDTEHYEGVFLQYNRWLTVEDGEYDAATIRANGEVVWSNWEGSGEEHTIDAQWIGHAVDLDGLGDRTTLELSWHLESDAGLFFGGWNIDDVCVHAPATVDNRMGITDFEAELQDGGEVELSWTNPGWAPLEKVVVVRQVGDFPASVDDGDVVYEDEAPEVGGAIAFTDPNETFVAGSYAVYGFDGEGWLSWTIEGWNAAEVQGTDALDELRDDYLEEVREEEAAAAAAAEAGEKGGCGCTSGAPTGVLGLPVLVGLLGLRRRR